MGKHLALAWGILVGAVPAFSACPDPQFLHAAQTVSVIFSDSQRPIFKSGLNFSVPGGEYLEFSADAHGVYLENFAGEVGLPVTVARVRARLLGKDFDAECHLLTLFPGERKLWSKWPEEIQKILDDRAALAAQSLRGDLTVEIYR